MNGQSTTRGASKPLRNQATMSPKNNGSRKTDPSGSAKQKHSNGSSTTRRAPESPTRRVNTSKNYVDSQRWGLGEKSPIPSVDKDFWAHIFAEVSAYRYPQFLHRLDNKAQEFEAIGHLYALCKTILTKEECRTACKNRLQKKAQRGELKLYRKDELI